MRVPEVLPSLENTVHDLRRALSSHAANVVDVGVVRVAADDRAVGVSEVEGVGERLVELGRVASPALHDGAVEQTLVDRVREERADGHSASGLAENGDLVGVAPKGGDVVLDPLQRHALVLDAVVPNCLAVTLRLESLVGEKAERAHPVVGGHDDDVLVVSKVLAVVPSELLVVAQNEGPAKDPKHHRKGLGRWESLVVVETRVLVLGDVD
mmetsp:Transcript_5612/g.10621  ORF Transcript_5612/g.10621 Transcript_5612/m.10621 type:complete len:211 (-) Transcript_5612:409-1041(-)